MKCVTCKGHIKKDFEGASCPHCSEKYFNKPEIEMKLFHLQDDFLETGSSEILGNFLVLYQKVAQNVIHSKLRSSGKYETYAEIEDMSMFCVEKMMKKLKKAQENPECRVISSFIGWTQQSALYPLYNDKKKERNQTEVLFSTSTTDSNSGDREQTIEGMLADQHNDQFHCTDDFFVREIEKEEVVLTILNILRFAFNKAVKEEGLTYAIKIRCLIKHFLNSGHPKFFASVWTRSPYRMKLQYEEMLGIVFQQLKGADSMSKETLWEQQINSIFEQPEPSEYDRLLNVVEMWIFKTNSDQLSTLYKEVGIKVFVRLLTIFSDTILKFPEIQDFQDTFVNALCYYYREVVGLEWDEVRELIPFPDLPSMKYGRNNLNFKIEMTNEVKKAIEELNL